MHQLKKNLNRFDLILYMVLFLSVLTPSFLQGGRWVFSENRSAWMQHLLCDRIAGCFAWLLRVTVHLIPS